MDRLPPKPTRFSKSAVHEFAEKIACRLAFESGDPIEPLVSRLGGIIEYKGGEEADRLPESIVVSSANNFVIYLPYVTSMVRDRFTISHELGHLFLHYPLVSAGRNNVVMIATRWVDETNEDLRRCEWEANWFAAGFLMPSSRFAEIYNSYNGDINRVAAKFMVSAKAAEVRARSLCL